MPQYANITLRGVISERIHGKTDPLFDWTIINLSLYLDSVIHHSSHQCDPSWAQHRLSSRLRFTSIHTPNPVHPIFLHIHNPSHSPFAIYTALVQAFILSYFLIVEAHFNYVKKKKWLNIKGKKKRERRELACKGTTTYQLCAEVFMHHLICLLPTTCWLQLSPETALQRKRWNDQWSFPMSQDNKWPRRFLNPMSKAIAMSFTTMASLSFLMAKLQSNSFTEISFHCFLCLVDTGTNCSLSVIYYTFIHVKPENLF